MSNPDTHPRLVVREDTYRVVNRIVQDGGATTQDDAVRKAVKQAFPQFAFDL